MKTALSTLAALLVAGLGVYTWSAEQAPKPTGTLPPGPTSITGSIGFTVYNNVIYLVREGAAVKIDPATIPAGHMMTLDGRLEPLPPGIVLPGAVAPDAEDPRPQPRDS